MPKIYGFILILAIMVACKAPLDSDSQAPKSKALPTAYMMKGDSLSSKALPWRRFFSFDSTLSSLIDSALRNNLDLKIAMQRVEMARSQVVLTKGIRAPDLSVGLGTGIRRIGKYTMDGVGNYDTKFSPNLNSKQTIPDPLSDFTIGFQSNWEIDVWGKLKSKKTAALNRFLSSENGRNLVLSNLVSEVATAYFELRAMDYELIVLRENLVLQQNALDIVIVQKETELATELGVEIMQAQLLSSKEKEVQIIQWIIESENVLSMLLGQFPNPISRKGNFLSDSTPILLPIGIPSDLLRQRPDILQAENDIRAAKADVASARTAFYPSLNLGTSLGYQAFSAALLLENPASMVYNAIGGITAPLLNRRVIKAQLLNAKAEQQQAYFKYQKTIILAFTEVYNSVKQIENFGKRSDLKREEVAVLRNAIGTSSDLFRTARANYLEVVNAQKNALMSQLELAELKKLQFKAVVDLYIALGGGWR